MCLSACSFNGVFFPIDQRENDKINSVFEQVTLVSTDKVNISSFMFTPSLPAKATIFALHGSGSTVGNWFKVVEPLVKDGYQVFMMDYRGFGASQGEAGHHKVAEDALAALSYLKTRDDVINKPLLILGQSYGGQAAIYATFYHQEAVDGLILEGTFTSFSEEAAHSSPWFVSPLVASIVSNAYESANMIKSVNINTLIIHSVEDNVVPFHMAQTLLSNSGANSGASAGVSTSAELWRINGKHVAGLIERPTDYVAKVNQLLSQAQLITAHAK